MKKKVPVLMPEGKSFFVTKRLPGRGKFCQAFVIRRYKKENKIFFDCQFGRIKKARLVEKDYNILLIREADDNEKIVRNYLAKQPRKEMIRIPMISGEMTREELFSLIHKVLVKQTEIKYFVKRASGQKKFKPFTHKKIAGMAKRLNETASAPLNLDKMYRDRKV